MFRRHVLGLVKLHKEQSVSDIQGAEQNVMLLRMAALICIQFVISIKRALNEVTCSNLSAVK